jgi:hypothetical protein
MLALRTFCAIRMAAQAFVIRNETQNRPQDSLRANLTNVTFFQGKESGYWQNWRELRNPFIAQSCIVGTSHDPGSST